MTDLIGARVYYPNWMAVELRRSGIVRAVDGSDGWRFLVEMDDGSFESVSAADATTRYIKEPGK